MGEVVASQKLYLFVPQRATGRIECSSLIANLLLVAEIRHVSQIKQISQAKGSCKFWKTRLRKKTGQ